MVRGEPSDGLLVTLDGLPLLEPFHLKDMGDALSIVDLASLGSAELMTGGPSAEYGDQIAGVFRLQTLTPRIDRHRAGAGLTLTNLRGMTQGGFAGVVIAGGLGLRIRDTLLKSGFAERFRAKGRFAELMASIPVKLIVHPQPGLFGAAAAFVSEHS